MRLGLQSGPIQCSPRAEAQQARQLRRDSSHCKLKRMLKIVEKGPQNKTYMVYCTKNINQYMYLHSRPIQSQMQVCAPSKTRQFHSNFRPFPILGVFAHRKQAFLHD